VGLTPKNTAIVRALVAFVWLFFLMMTVILFCSVDASRAGQGPLTIDIMYNGKLIPAQIAPDRYREKQFNVKFKPRGPGYYTIRVFFSDVEITGTVVRIYTVSRKSQTIFIIPVHQLCCENCFIHSVCVFICLSVHCLSVCLCTVCLSVCSCTKKI